MTLSGSSFMRGVLLLSLCWVFFVPPDWPGAEDDIDENAPQELRYDVYPIAMRYRENFQRAIELVGSGLTFRSRFDIPLLARSPLVDVGTTGINGRDAVNAQMSLQC